MNEIVTAVQFRDHIIIFTRDGTIYRMYVDEVTGKIVISRLMELFPR